MDKNSKIGVFDSGLGGLSVLKQFIRFLPQESYIYLGDTARVPYGNKSSETIKKYARECTEFFIEKSVKLIVVACNTVSSVALDTVIKYAGNIPVIGMIKPAANAALRATLNKKIGVIGTRGTITSKAYSRELNTLANNDDYIISESACPLFVPFVEEGMTRHQAAKIIADEYLSDLRESGIDTLVLGCTHYPLLSHLISELMPNVTLIDSGEHAAVTSLRLLAEKNILRDESYTFVPKPDVKFYVTDLPHNFYMQANLFLGFEVEKPELIEIEI